MVEKLKPEINEVYFMEQHTLIHVLAGKGSIEVDFKTYPDWQDKGIFLEKGQYIRFRSDDFLVRKIVFPSEAIFSNKDVRVLFKHLISLGYIDFKECAACQQYLEQRVFSDHTGIIDVSSAQWYWENPFNASKDEYQLIFDIKDIIDEVFDQQLSSTQIVDVINQQGYDIQHLVRDKIGLSVKGLMQKKRITESKREVAFTDKSIQEVSYDMGFKDPAYFHRFFKKTTGQSPGEFRENFDFVARDQFMQYLLELISAYHAEERSIGFYADQMNLSVKSLSRKVSHKMNTTLGAMIRTELLNTAKNLLDQGASVKETAAYLKFEEANHFSAFFKHHSGVTPTSYLKKYNS